MTSTNRTLYTTGMVRASDLQPGDVLLYGNIWYPVTDVIHDYAAAQERVPQIKGVAETEWKRGIPETPTMQSDDVAWKHGVGLAGTALAAEGIKDPAVVARVEDTRDGVIKVLWLVSKPYDLVKIQMKVSGD